MADDLTSFVAQVRASEPRALARAISAVENRAPESVALLKALFAHSGQARILGLTGAHPAEKYYRDVKVCTIGEGTSEIQRMVIARQLLKD